MMEGAPDLNSFKETLKTIRSSDLPHDEKILRLKELADRAISFSTGKEKSIRVQLLMLANQCISDIEKLRQANPQRSEANNSASSEKKGASNVELKKNKQNDSPTFSQEAENYVRNLHPLISSTSFDNIAGLAEVKKIVITQIIKARENVELARMFGISGRNILLFGPPGTGKTSIAQAISNKVQYPLLTITPSDILDNRFGEFEKNIKYLFHGAVLNSPIIVFFDEFESLATRRTSSNSSYMKRAVPEMLRQMTDMRKQPESKVMIIAATNNPWDVDDAMLNPERFDTKIYVPPPDVFARTELFRTFLGGLKVADNINYEELGPLSDGFTGADIKYICKRAAEEVFAEVVDKNEIRAINQDDIRRSIEKSSTSVNSDLLAKYAKFMEKFNI